MVKDLVAFYGGGWVVDPRFVRAVSINSLRSGKIDGLSSSTKDELFINRLPVKSGEEPVI
jgi:hypothetical protein